MIVSLHPAISSITQSANGIACFGPATFVSTAFILSMFAQRRCNFLSVNDENLNTTGNGRSYAVDDVGVFCLRDTHGNNWLYSDGVNSLEAVKGAQSLSLATTIMGATAWALFALAGCVRIPPILWLLVSSILAATAVTEGLVYRDMFNNCDGGECSRGTGAKCAIAAMTFWSVSTLMCFGVFKEAQDKAKDRAAAERLEQA